MMSLAGINHLDNAGYNFLLTHLFYVYLDAYSDGRFIYCN